MARGRVHPLPRRERIAAAVITGPAGHLYGGLADWAVLVARLGRARARGWARRWCSAPPIR